ncbi:hypothetical protein GGP68_001422 [Salinibacter ruber]|jgi:hypothetical protein|uniref:Secreted protein n=1 Tax=Salinibacter ruber TaxID=146919 RepID=A0A9X2Q6V6_9BACT|nr:hypothetical protein [Salinibacter ruber]MCS3709700.1 hypothetical protein [Salinibacter ruber]MCS3715195.1 hypothetical protein [Salinibacter ruber]MCS4122344.1 hypothetical protein [Salinibacter ruber]
MKLLSRPFEKTRVLVALALLFSAAAPLVQYTCGVTGETTTTSTLVAETGRTTTAPPCGTVSTGVHDRLCGGAPSATVCDGGACTTDTVEKESVILAEISKLRLTPTLSSGGLLSEKAASSRSVVGSHWVWGSDWSARAPNHISVRLRTLSFRL